MIKIGRFLSLSALLRSVIFLALLPGNLLQAEPSAISVYPGMKAINVTKKLEIYNDRHATSNLQSIRAGGSAALFQKVEKDSFNFLQGTQWVKALVENTSSADVTVFFQFDVSSHITLNFFPLQNPENPQVFEAGWKLPFKKRVIPFMHPTFEVHVPPGRSDLIIKNEGSGFYMDVGSPAAVTEVNSTFESLLIFCLATFLSLGLFNLFIYVRTLDKGYVLNSIRCLLKILGGLFIYGAIGKFFLHDATFNHKCVEATLVGLIYLSWLVVSRQFLPLDLYVKSKFFDRFINVLIIGLVVACIVPWVLPNVEPQMLVRAFGPVSLLSSMFMGIYLCLRRCRPAYFYMLASLVYFAGIITIILASEGVIALTPATFLAPSFGGAIEAILMSFGLGDKYMMAMKATNLALNERNVKLDRNLSVMLKNLDQGIFSIGESGQISKEHSEYLKTIFNDAEIGGKDAFETLFKESDFPGDSIDQIKSATLAGIGEDLLTFEMNQHLFPHEIVRHVKNRDQFLEVDWRPLQNSDNRCESMMIVLRDVSHLRALQKETAKNQRDLKIAGQVLAATLRNYDKFAENASQLLSQNLLAIERFKVSNVLEIALMFRNIHTIKGNARTFGLSFFADAAHEIENYFSDLRAGIVPIPDAFRLIADVHILQSLQDEYIGVIRNVLKVAPKDGPEDLIETLNHLHEENITDEEVKERFYTLAENQRIARFYPTLEEMLSPVLRNQSKMAEELAKPAPQIDFDCHGLRLNVEMETVLRSIFTQILRNSIDHGIEAPGEREEIGKKSKGKVMIKIETSLTQRDLVLEIHDDGAGLDLAALARKNPIPGQSDEAIADIIFQTGVSTAQKVTHISGRGVGMDIIHELVTKHSGTIAIVFTKPRTPTGRRPFKLVMTFPSSVVLSGNPRQLGLAYSAGRG